MTHTKLILEAMLTVETGALRGALCGCQAVRQASGMEKSEFDRQVLAMAAAGMVSLHKHDWPSSLTNVEKQGMVHANGTYYVGFAIRIS